MKICNCTTGSEEDGWQEVRCEFCIQQERAQWARLTSEEFQAELAVRLRKIRLELELDREGKLWKT